MRLIDADKLQPDRMTDKGLAISQSQIANAPTVCDIDCAIKSEGYMRGVNDDRNLWEHRIKQIRADIEAIEINGQADEHTMFIRTGEQVKQMALDIIDKYTKGE